MALHTRATHLHGSARVTCSSLGQHRLVLGSLQQLQLAAQGYFAPRPVAPCAASVGQAHSHLGEALMDMQQARREAADLLDQQQLERLHRQQQQHLAVPSDPVQDVQRTHLSIHTVYHVPRAQHAQHRQHSLTHHHQPQHVFRDRTSTHQQQHVFRSAVHTRTRTFVNSTAPIPHLDGDLVDAAAVLTQLRSELTEHKGTVIVTADHSAAALLDLVSVMILLDEDVRQEDPGSVVLFQPVIDLRRKLAASNRQLSVAARRQLQQRAQDQAIQSHGDEWGDGMAALQQLHTGVSVAAVQQHAHGGQDVSWGSAAVSSYGPATTWSTNTAMTAVTQPVIAALVTKARCPKLAVQRPSYCITACAAIADATMLGTAIVKAVHSRGSVRLRVAGDAPDLVSAWHAMRHARMIVRGQTGATKDLLITPHLTSEPAPAMQAHAAVNGSEAGLQPRAASRKGKATSISQSYEEVPCSEEGMCEDDLSDIPQRQQLSHGAEAVSPQQQQQGERGVMCFNIWLR